LTLLWSAWEREGINQLEEGSSEAGVLERLADQVADGVGDSLSPVSQV
jgi:hypothetical protein